MKPPMKPWICASVWESPTPQAFNTHCMLLLSPTRWILKGPSHCLTSFWCLTYKSCNSNHSKYTTLNSVKIQTEVYFSAISCNIKMQKQTSWNLLEFYNPSKSTLSSVAVHLQKDSDTHSSPYNMIQLRVWRMLLVGDSGWYLTGINTCVTCDTCVQVLNSLVVKHNF